MTRKRRPTALPMAQLAPAAFCPTDGGELRDGFCLTAGGYPYFTEDEQGLKRRPCEFACPICRKPLDWSGACRACRGTTTGRRKDWAFPGDRYDRFSDDGIQIGDGLHWVKTDGPRMACASGMNVENAALIQRAAARLPLRWPDFAQEAD